MTDFLQENAWKSEAVDRSEILEYSLEFSDKKSWK